MDLRTLPMVPALPALAPGGLLGADDIWLRHWRCILLRSLYLLRSISSPLSFVTQFYVVSQGTNKVSEALGFPSAASPREKPSLLAEKMAEP